MGLEYVDIWNQINMDGEPENHVLWSHTTIYMYEVIGLVFTLYAMCVNTLRLVVKVSRWYIA